MSQSPHQKPAPKHPPTSEHKRPKPPIGGLSPDDDLGVTSDETGKPAAPAK